jgi:hypothetical protein
MYVCMLCMYVCMICMYVCMYEEHSNVYDMGIMHACNNAKNEACARATQRRRHDDFSVRCGLLQRLPGRKQQKVGICGLSL